MHHNFAAKNLLWIKNHLLNHLALSIHQEDFEVDNDFLSLTQKQRSAANRTISKACFDPLVRFWGIQTCFNACSEASLYTSFEAYVKALLHNRRYHSGVSHPSVQPLMNLEYEFQK